jgi:hypothetical protein
MDRPSENGDNNRVGKEAHARKNDSTRGAPEIWSLAKQAMPRIPPLHLVEEKLNDRSGDHFRRERVRERLEETIDQLPCGGLPRLEERKEKNGRHTKEQ